ncbi:Ribulose-phosphate 3-epimerase [Paraliobacillus sp. PM-2]|uniref:ribulose-phosphate 3-epimerase n=1 Tax=Paraliobacillus sp. PM-2 TaxID=1462524 RepID=UPI00061BEA2F|nr:ribulose-phosphate 3-epimerase [Paraliobacillus sp. PM-2]CQR47741.1 Ribulose-phosphate 3-epimerase [Paraliobacillus sp. PM-2]
MTKIAPSILSADFAQLKKEIIEVEQGGADYIHIDVMDGHFVPNITIGPLIVEAIRPITTLPLDVHLMIDNPDHYIDAFASAGADIITVHVETCNHLHRTIHSIKERGVKAGVVINPATPAVTLYPILKDIDLVLFMTVNPGFGGQKFIPNVIDKIKQVDEWRQAFAPHVEFEVDGGINEQTAKLCTEAGVDVLVAGSAIFGKKDRKEAIQVIRQASE